jgi:flagellin
MGSFSILNTISGMNAQNQLNLNNVNLTKTFLRLSSGKRINTGADDAAGLQIVDSLRANTYALNQAVRNANDGIGICQIADGALYEITNLLTRSVGLAAEAATETIDSSGRASLQAEYRQINMEIARIADQTNFNGTYIFHEGAGVNGHLGVFVGDISGSSSIAVSIGTISTHAGYAPEYGAEISCGSIGNALGSPDYQNLDLVDLATSQHSASDGMAAIKSGLNAVSRMRGEIGTGINRLHSAVAVLQTQSQNTLAAESTIRDANIAEEVANLTRYQILAQSGIAALAQANSGSQAVLSLLRG